MCTSTSVASTPGNQHCTLAVALPGLHELNLRNTHSGSPQLTNICSIGAIHNYD